MQHLDRTSESKITLHYLQGVLIWKLNLFGLAEKVICTADGWGDWPSTYTTLTLFKNFAATCFSVLTDCVPSFRYAFDEHDLSRVSEKAMLVLTVGAAWLT